MRNPGRFPPRKVNCNGVALPKTNYFNKVHAGSFLCFHNPPNSDMDYRVFNVPYVIILMRCVYTRGVGHTGKTNTSFGDCFGISDLCQSNPQSSCLFCLWLGTPTASQNNILTRTNSHRYVVYFCGRRGSNLGSLDLESDALPTEPSRHPVVNGWR